MKSYNLQGIPPEIWKRVRLLAIEEGLTIKALLLKAVSEYLEKRGG